MKKFITFVLLLALGFYIIVIQRITVEPSNEAVMIKKPWFYGSKGIATQPIRPEPFGVSYQPRFDSSP